MSIFFYIGLVVVVISLLVIGVTVAAGFGRVIRERDKQIPRKDDAQ